MLIRKSSERGHKVISWLKSWHTFSFGDYFDPHWQSFNQLRVINEDFIAPSMGFGTHPHRDMEIITYVIKGELRHEDSMGNLGIIKPGEIQVMSAGTGITHSEHNNKNNEETHLLQIWVMPNSLGLTPRYDQRPVFDPEEFNFFKVIASPFKEKSEGVSLNADAKFWLGRYDHEMGLNFKPTLYSNYWVHIIRGSITVNNRVFTTGDAFGEKQNTECKIEIDVDGAEFLIIEVA